MSWTPGNVNRNRLATALTLGNGEGFAANIVDLLDAHSHNRAASDEWKLIKQRTGSKKEQMEELLQYLLNPRQVSANNMRTALWTSNNDTALSVFQGSAAAVGGNVVERNGTERNGTERNETERNGTDREFVGHAIVGNPLSAAVATQMRARTKTVLSFIRDDELKHFRTTICAVMDETHSWEKLLASRGLLGGEGVEQFVSNLKQQWTQRRDGEPTLTVLNSLCSTDNSFASMPLNEFAQELIDLRVPAVQTEVLKLTSWLEEKNTKAKQQSQTAYSAQSDLRGWLLKHHICDTDEVDRMIPHLRRAGVKSVDSIRGFSKEDLKECGFNTVQAIATVNALNKI